MKPKMTNEDMTMRHSKKHSIPSKRTKDDSEYVFMKASLALKEGRLAEAEKGYLEVLRRKPDWGQVLKRGFGTSLTNWTKRRV